jgi:hypothetical protein
MNIRNLDQSKVWDYENGFNIFASPERMNKVLAHYEIYKKITKLPGDIWELGVYKAASLLRFATFRNALEESQERLIVGFDAFGKFPSDDISMDTDHKFIERFEEHGGDGFSEIEIEKIINLKNFKNIKLKKGNVINTLPKYLEENPNTTISLLHLDMDVFEPTIFSLNTLFDHVIEGGIILIDDYNSVEGATRAVDNFINEKNIKLHKCPFNITPVYIQK